MMTYNVDTNDNLTNGAFGEVLGYKFDQWGKIKQVYVHFFDEECGKNRRKNFPDLQSQYNGKSVTPIERMEFRYSLSKKKRNTVNATAYQYPLRLAFAATAHKVQGQTIKKPNFLVADLRKVREAAQAYVVLSRVQSLDQLFLIGDACIDKIYPSIIAMKELDRMNAIAFNLQDNPQNIIVSCNVRSLDKNFAEFANATIVTNAENVCLQETWTKDHQSDKPIPNLTNEHSKKSHPNSAGRGKGILTMFDEAHSLFEKDVKNAFYQMTKITSQKRDIINIYRSHGANNLTFKEDLKYLIDKKKDTIIVGDFNICFKKNPNHEVFKMLIDLGFQQLISQPTHIDGGTIDLVFTFCSDKMVKYEVVQQAQFFLDHDIISVRYLIL